MTFFEHKDTKNRTDNELSQMLQTFSLPLGDVWSKKCVYSKWSQVSHPSILVSSSFLLLFSVVQKGAEENALAQWSEDWTEVPSPRLAGPVMVQSPTSVSYL